MKRLEAIFSLITPCKLFADIGTDHGYIAEYAANLCTKVIAADISEECLAKAKHNVTAPNVEFRAGDGLSVLNSNRHSDTPDIIAVCGMGGRTIIEILSGYQGKATLILQPQSDVSLLREFLVSRGGLGGYIIEKDFVAYERGKYYDILLVSPSDSGESQELDELAVSFGKFYRQKSELLLQRLLKMRKSILSYKQTDENIAKLKQIDEVLSWQK